MLRCAAGQVRAWAVEDCPGRAHRDHPPGVPARHADPRDRVRNRAGGGDAHRFHAGAQWAIAPGPHRCRASRTGDDGDGAGAALRLRRVGAVGHAFARGQRGARDRRPRSGGTALAGPAGRTRPDHGGKVRDLRRRYAAVRPELWTIARRGACQDQRAGCARAYRTVLAQMGRSLQSGRRLGRAGAPFAHHAEGAHLAPTGGIVAAPTTSLPEKIGGIRNWDYRFCWLRDATLTLLSLLEGGYTDEAKAWRDWLLRAVAGDPTKTQIMYGLAGERRLTEWEVPWLEGYEKSRPVRSGNAAQGQFQLDGYGEVSDARHQARK